MHWVAKPGTGIDVVRDDILTVSREMLAETTVKEFGSHIARAEVGEEIYGANFSELWVSVDGFDGDYKARATTSKRSWPAIPVFSTTC